MKNCTLNILILSLVLTSCQTVETGESLDEKTKAQIKKLGLLKDNEKIIKYYSNYEKDKAGNFFTDKRIAHYWLDQHDALKTDISFAYYQDIISIDTTYQAYDFNIPYMTIMKKDSSTFKVYIDGTLEQKKSFFEEAMHLWNKSKSAK